MRGYADIPRRFNLASYFLDRNLEEGRADRTALICPEGRYSFAQLARLADQTGHVLRDLGVEMEDRVLLALGDGVELVAAWFAAVKIGAVPAEVYTFLAPKDYQHFLNYTRAKVVLADGLTRQSIAEARAGCPHLRHVLVAGEPGGLAAGEVGLAERLAQAPARLEAAETTKDDIALWKFTTGSTGAPKAAVHCHHDPVVNYWGYARGVLDLQPDDLVLPVPKLFFGYARDLTALYNFGVGAAGIVFPERSTPEGLFTLVREHRPTIFVQVPTMLNAMASHPDAPNHDLGSLRLCTSAGEALPREIYEKWMRAFGVQVLDGIGSSEAYHIYISNRPGAVRPGSMGQLVPGYQARLVDEEGREAAQGQVGELCIGGDSTALLYWNEHQKSKETFHGDWVRTGDLALRDPEGYFWYRGRRDDLLKVGGIWVAPLEVEARLLEHPAVLECGVAGYEEEGLTLSRAYVVLRQGHQGGAAVAEELQRFLRQRLAPHKAPRDIRFVSELPKTPSGKLDRRRLRDCPPA